MLHAALAHLEGSLGVQHGEVVDDADVTGAQLVVQPQLVAHGQGGEGPVEKW